MLQYVIALFTILLFLVLFFLKPKIETYVMYVLVALPFIDTKILPLEFGFVRTFDLITIIAFLFLFKKFIIFTGKIKFYFVIAVLLILITILSGLNSEFGFANYYNYYPIITIFIFTRFLFIYVKEDLKAKYEIINYFKIGFSITLFFMLLQVLFGLRVNYFGEVGLNVISDTASFIRYPGLFAESQKNGQFIALGSFLFLMNLKDLSFNKKYFSYILFCISVILMFLAGSRSAIGGFLIASSFLILFSNVRIKITSAAFVLLGYFLFSLISINNGALSRTDRIENDLDFRQEVWQESFEIAKTHPIFGIGLGNFQNYTTKYNQDLYLEISPGDYLYFTQPENGYLKILVEQGSLVFLIFCILFLMPLINSIFNYLRGNLEFEVLFVVSVLIGWLISFNTIYSISDYRILVAVATFLSFLIVNNHRRILGQ
tara:strand:- start:11829 stop:13121 length:1293 start_codon:yes stop_codon:yes gene_type:complete